MILVDVPFNREELRERLRRPERMINPDTNRRTFRTAQHPGFLRWLESLISLLEGTILAVSNLSILTYQLFKYAFMAVLVLFGLVLAYYGFKYVLLLMICLQNNL